MIAWIIVGILGLVALWVLSAIAVSAMKLYLAAIKPRSENPQKPAPRVDEEAS